MAVPVDDAGVGLLESAAEPGLAVPVPDAAVADALVEVDVVAEASGAVPVPDAADAIGATDGVCPGAVPVAVAG